MLIDIRFAREKIYEAVEPVLTGFPPSGIFEDLLCRYGNEPSYIINKLIDQFAVVYKHSQRGLRNRLGDHMEKLC